MKIAITGGTGFLGSSLVRKLSECGHEIHMHARNAGKAESLRKYCHKVVICEIDDKQAIGKLVAGCDIVIHTVSNFRSASGSIEDYRRINVEGTINTYQRAREAQVQRFIHISTIGVLGDIKECPASETTEYNPGDDYQRTKLEAELYCLDQASCHHEMELVVIRPCSMYGPGDMRMLKMFRMLKKGSFFVIGSCQSNFHAVYIDDIVNGIMASMTTPDIHREVFIIGGDQYVPLKEYISTAANAVGASYPRIRLPFAPMYALSAIVEFICVPLKIEPPIFRRRVKFYKNNRAFDITKARKRLGYQPSVSLFDGMTRTVDWYQKEKLL